MQFERLLLCTQCPGLCTRGVTSHHQPLWHKQGRDEVSCHAPHSFPQVSVWGGIKSSARHCWRCLALVRPQCWCCVIASGLVKLLCFANYLKMLNTFYTLGLQPELSKSAHCLANAYAEAAKAVTHRPVFTAGVPASAKQTYMSIHLCEDSLACAV